MGFNLRFYVTDRAAPLIKNNDYNKHGYKKEALRTLFHVVATIPIVGCEPQHKTAMLFMWEKHRSGSFYGLENCGKSTISHRRDFPNGRAFHTSIIRPSKQA